MKAYEMLKKVKSGEVSIEEAESFFSRDHFYDMGYAKLDTHRKMRSGFAEVIFCSGKSDEHLFAIFKKLFEDEGEVLGTRASKEQFELIRKDYPQAEYDSVSKIIKIEKENKKREGKIAVCSAGTSDIPVAEEAAQVAEYFGSNVERIYDIGVSGIHSMEGALASVIGGLVDVPVIAVPTSVGYGANMNGLSALLTMINSCANGITVVNIDNGYGAGYVATQINRLGERK